ncbi:hypothetical protein ACGRHY_00760 [Streptomyces sp. HK10]|uniref:hypothetical protein n=1 Tax=Streptomyces sp. HK10 TaxID=3373255 RepID=UPI003748E173
MITALFLLVVATVMANAAVVCVRSAGPLPTAEAPCVESRIEAPASWSSGAGREKGREPVGAGER